MLVKTVKHALEKMDRRFLELSGPPCSISQAVLFILQPP
jgi:hypothetical protein